MGLYLLSEQMAFDVGHYVLKVQNGYEAASFLIRSSEALDGVLLVEVVQELAELAVGNGAFLVATEV